MEHDNGRTVSVWMKSAPAVETQPLAEDLRADVCVVGAGIAGLTTAYLLAAEGRSVVVLEDGPIGGGMTQRTTAHLSNAIDDRYSEIERLRGANGAQLATQSHSAAIDRIEAIVAEEGIDCDFERLDGYLFTPPGESKEILERELEAAHRAGLNGVAKVERAPLSDFDTGWCLRFPRQAQFDPMKYLQGLCAGLREMGGRIFTGTHAAEVRGGDPAQVRSAEGFTVSAAAVVVATNSPISDVVAILRRRPKTDFLRVHQE